MLSILLTAPHVAAGDRDAPPALHAFDDWSQLAPLPDDFGFAGPFVGVSDGALIVAGGANFPDGPPWDGKAKVWHDRIFVLADPAGQWQQLDTRLPAKLGYGVSITTPDGILCIGGCDAQACSQRVFLLQWDRKLQSLNVTQQLESSQGDSGTLRPPPELPVPLAFMGGALVGDAVYVAGGQQAMGEGAAASAEFWRLDLSQGYGPADDEGPFAWERLPWPKDAAPRILPVTAAQLRAGQEHFYMFSGRDRPSGADAGLLTDAWAFSPDRYASGKREPKGSHGGGPWRRLADCPRCLMAGCGVAVGIDHVLVIGGDDGRHWGRDLRDAHPGFADDMLFAFHTLTDTWVPAGQLPENHVTTTAVMWQDRAGRPAVIIPSGEIRPGVRTPAVWSATLARSAAKFNTIDYLVLVVYLGALVAMGFYFSRREKSTADFFLAGRRIPWWAAGLSIFGTQLSAITFMAIPAKTYADDWVFFWQNMGIVAIAPLVAWVYLPFFRRLDVTTAYEYLEKRFSVTIRLLGSATFVVFQLGRMGIVVFLPALALAAVTGWNIYLCIAAMGILATLYTVLGGIEAVIWTDVLQVFVLLGGACIALAIIIGSIDGGLSHAFSIAAANDKLQLANFQWDFTSEALVVILLGAFFNNIVPYTTDQAVIQRYLTTRDEKQARGAIWTNAVLTVPASLLFFAVGTALWVYYREHPAALMPLDNGDQIFPWFIARQLPMGVAGLVIAGIFAAAMSSLDSGMNSVATACVTDFYRRFRPAAADHHCLNVARWLTVWLGVLGTGTAMFMAGYEIKSLWELFLGLIGLLGGTLAGLFGLGIFTRRTAAVHAWIGALASAAILAYVKTQTPVSHLLYAAVGASSCFVVGWAASFLLPATPHSEGLTYFSLPRSTEGD